MGNDVHVQIKLGERLTEKDVRNIVKSLESIGDMYADYFPNSLSLEKTIENFVAGKDAFFDFSPDNKKECSFLYSFFFSEEKDIIIISAPGGAFDHRSENAKDNSRKLKEVAVAVWNAVSEKAVSGEADTEMAFDWIRSERSDTRHAFWLNFYGREMVGKYGEERMLKAPLYEARKLKNGVLLATRQGPFDRRPESGLKDVKKHFGEYRILHEKKKGMSLWFKQGKWNIPRRMKREIGLRMALSPRFNPYMKELYKKRKAKKSK